MVYIIDKYGQPLMPTERHGKIRRLLKDNKAIVVRRCPFTIRLIYDTTGVTQPVALGIDAGSKYVGASATAENKELYASETILRNDITCLLSARRELRAARRSRKTRYRQPRFNNRKTKEGWIAPSVEQKINSHIKIVYDICQILPITKIIIETASFDAQKIKNPDIKGEEYQQGEQLDFWNVREYVLCRDGHKCQCCKGKSKDEILNVHHIESRRTGGDAPNNLITLCATCHQKYHRGEIELPKTIKRGISLRDEAFMGIMRWAFYDRLKNIYPGMVSMTFGYITKNTRIRNNLLKTHAVDARCISGNPLAKPIDHCYKQRKVRCHNRQLHRLTVRKGGVRKINQAPYVVYGFRLFDKVKYNGKEYFIIARRQSGYFALGTIDGAKVSDSVNYKKLKLIETRKNYILI